MLQCRTGKRTGAGAVKIAVDMVKEGLVKPDAAVMMVEPRHLDQLLHPQVNKRDQTYHMKIKEFELILFFQYFLTINHCSSVVI